MSAQITVRLPDDLSMELVLLSRRLRLKRSDIIRMALEKFAREFRGGSREKEPRPFERVKHLLGSINSGLPDLGSNHRKYLIEGFKKRA